MRRCPLTLSPCSPAQRSGKELWEAKSQGASFLESPHEISHVVSRPPAGIMGSLGWACALPARAISSGGSGVVRCVVGLGGGLTSNVKLCLSIILSSAPGACSRSRCLFRLLFGLGVTVFCSANWGAKLVSQETWAMAYSHLHKLIFKAPSRSRLANCSCSLRGSQMFTSLNGCQCH